MLAGCMQLYYAGGKLFASPGRFTCTALEIDYSNHDLRERIGELLTLLECLG